MKKLILFFVTLLLCFTIEEIAYAGNLNEHELAIIEAAGEVYEYNGISYKAEERYIDQLVNYLSRDDIDITAGDKDLIIQIAYDNIELGIRDGYLKPIDDMNKQGEHEDKGIETSMEDSVKEILESVGMDISDIESYMPSIIAYSDIIEKIDDGTDTSNGVDNTTDMNINHDDLVDKDNNNMEDEVIKQTGFNLDRTIYIMIGLGFLMIIGIFIAIKNNYYNHAYE